MVAKYWEGRIISACDRVSSVINCSFFMAPFTVPLAITLSVSAFLACERDSIALGWREDPLAWPLSESPSGYRLTVCQR
jgi:hypothetical protein